MVELVHFNIFLGMFLYHQVYFQSSVSRQHKRYVSLSPSIFLKQCFQATQKGQVLKIRYHPDSYSIANKTFVNVCKKFVELNHMFGLAIQ